MGWSGKFIGGAIGAFIGGPLGAAVGAGLGHLADGDEEADEQDTLAEFDESLESVPVVTPSGPSYRLRVSFTAESVVPHGTIVVFRLLDAEGGLLRGAVEWADSDGDFAAVSEVEASDEGLISAEVVVPYMAPTEPHRVHAIVALAVSQEDVVVPATNWTFDGFRRKDRWENNTLGGVLALAVAMCRQNGGPSTSERAAILANLVEGYELDARGTEAAEAAMKSLVARKSKPDDHAIWFEDDVEFAGSIAAFLETVAVSDGPLKAHETEFISTFRKRFDVRDDPSDDDEGEGEAAPRKDSLAEHYEALDLKPGVTFVEVKAAYRRLAAEYHPDRAAKLGSRYQAFANREMQRINGAYEALRELLEP